MTSTFKQTTEELTSDERLSRIADDFDLAILQLGTSNEKCQGSGYIVGGYFNAVIHEPNAQLGHPFLNYESQINQILGVMRGIGRLYLFGETGVRPATQSEIININVAVQSYCDFHLAVLEYLDTHGTPLSTEDTVEILNDMSHDANRGRNAALTIQNQLNEFSLNILAQSNQMRNIADGLGASAGVVSSQIEQYRRELETLDIDIDNYEQQLATQEDTQTIQPSFKIIASATILGRVFRHIMRGIALIRSVREAGEEIQWLRDRLAQLHDRRGSVYFIIYTNQQAVAAAESYNEHVDIQGKRTRQALHYMGNMANSWGAQAAALEDLKQLTITENRGSSLLRINLNRAESSIRRVYEEASRIRREMTNVPFNEEQDLTISELYRRGTTSTGRTQLEYPNLERESVKQSLIEKYGK